MELNDVERLAVAQAFQKAVGELTETKREDNLRGRVDAEMKEAFYSNPMAGRSFDVKLLGEKVGTYSLTVSKPAEQRAETELEVEDAAAFRKWAEDAGFVMVDERAVFEHFADSGEVPGGCRAIEVVTPADPGGEVASTTLKVEPERVARVLGAQLPEATMALLEGGFDD